VSAANDRITHFQIVLHDTIDRLNDLCPGEGACSKTVCRSQHHYVFATATWGLIMARWMLEATQSQRNGDYAKVQEVVAWMEEGLDTLRGELEKLLVQTDELQGGAEEAADTADWIMSEILDRGKKQ
jgi:hypothetical protein